MVAEHVVRPRPRRQRPLERLDPPTEPISPPARMEHGEVEREVQLVVGPIVRSPAGPVVLVDLPDGQPLRPVVIQEGSYLPEHPVDVRMGPRTQRRRHVAVGFGIRDRGGGGRVVTEFRVLHQEVGHVDAEPVHPAVEPEAHHPMHRRLHRGVAPVEVGLLGQEGVQVVLAGGRIPLPGRPAEHGLPVVGRRPAGAGVPPHVPITPGAVAARTGLQEPGVPVGGVVGDQVDDQAQAALVGGGQKTIEVAEVAEQRIDPAVVGHVVAEVGQGRRVERG